MKNNHKNRTKHSLQHPVRKKLCSILIAGVMFATSMPNILYEGLSGISITAFAKNEDNFQDNQKPSEDKSFSVIASPAELAEYSKYYHYYASAHHGDSITIQYGQGETNLTVDEFIAIGTSDYPFDGTITVIDSTGDSDIKIPEAFFNYVSDKATITGTLILQRSTKASSEPVFARYITHDSSTLTAKSWNVRLNQYVNDYNQTISDNYYSGFIGEMQNGAIVNISINDNNGAVVSGTDDLGYVCGKMGRNTQLTVSMSGTNTGYTVSTSSGNVGGFVGSMDDKSVLTLNSAPLRTNAPISTSNGYAGGIVGYNDGGIVKFGSGVTYTVNGTITGTTAAGGLFGYYRPLFDDPTTAEITETNAGDIDIANFSVNASISSLGNAGGLFGELMNKSVTVTDAVLDETGAVTTPESRTDGAGGTLTISDGSVTCTLNGSTNIGGIAGTYEPFSLADTLEISGVSTSITNSGSYDNYGGAIGMVSTTAHDGVTEAAYVQFSSFTLTGASSCGTKNKFFGGLIGKGEKAYVDASGIAVTATGFKGGGIVGNLGNGVLKLSGIINLTNAAPSQTDVVSTKEGQYVGYRDNALIYSDAATLSRNDRKVDNVGAWGDILVLDGTTLSKANILTEDSSAHTITMAASSNVITNAADFARLALAMQINYSSNPILSGTSATPANVTIGTAAAGQTPAACATIDLSNTGLKGLTRDNALSDSDTKYQSAITTIIGIKDSSDNRSSITLDIQNVGGKPIYRHAYNGLLGENTAALTITDVDFGGTMQLEPCVTMYAGLAAAKSAAITANTCNVLSSAEFSDYYHISEDEKNKWGASDLCLGRLVGVADGTVIISGGTYDGKIGDPTVTTDAWASSADNCYGGVIGQISSGASAFKNVTVSGTIKNDRAKATQKLGGLVAVIDRAAGAVALSNVTTNGLTVYGNATASCGGLLGYGWYNSDVTVGDSGTVGVNVGISTTEDETTTISGHSKVTASGGGTAGLVYCATGKWTVNNLAINGLTVSAGPSSFGMIVNKGWDKGSDGKSTKQAIYMLLPSGYSYVISTTDVTLPSISVFDELVAYSAENGNVTENWQGIVSIHTASGALTMDGTAANTYTAQTSLGKNNSNPNTRYYYNLDTIASSSANSITGTDAAQKKLMNWGLYQYACSNIRSNFCDPFGTEITDGTYDMVGYSWYPVDVTSDIEVNGTFKFYNYEIETGIGAKTDTNYKTLEASQHTLMQNALFHNVIAKLTVGGVTLQGNVGMMTDGSGALVCGTVKGSSSSDSDTAEVKVGDGASDGIVLDGIHVHNLTASTDYAPLLINKSGKFSTLTIKGVKVNALTSYSSSNDTTILKVSNAPKIATSLIGNCGESSNDLNVSVAFSDIQLDGRAHGTLLGTSALDDNYHTSESLFTKATLLNKLIYSTGGGTYKYSITDDWTKTSDDPLTYGTHSPVKVTYGSEISGGETVDGKKVRVEFIGKEFWYDNQSHTSGYYVTPTAMTATGNAGVVTDTAGNVTSYTVPYDFSGFLPYVFTKYYGATEGETGAHQLKVNHESPTFTGCGTYNDPYIIPDGNTLVNIAKMMNSNSADDALSKIRLPKNSSDVVDLSLTWSAGYYEYDRNGSNFEYTGKTTFDLADVRTYMAGAYYKIGSDEITIGSSSGFTGLGNIGGEEDTFAVFRGVIVGTGTETIINQTNYPLIASSYGSVVRGLTIEVDSQIAKSNDTATNPFTPGTAENKCDYYGAVIGQIFGGDNIIDNVYVDFTDATVTISGSAAHVIPVGGYVGVLLNGGLYFRNMDRANSLVGGLSNDKTFKGSEHLITKEETTTVNGQSVTNTVPNMKYLYVNPIIGRVMNGFAITETDTFRPFEDGTRTYPDGSHVYFNGSTFVEKDAGAAYSGAKVGVTMRNGTKNYSIADIDKSKNADNSATFTMKDSSGNVSGANGATISVSDAQQLFLISCITQAGLGQSNNGQYYDEKQYYNFDKPANPHDDFFIQSYADNMSTRHGNYNEVGISSLTDYNSYAINDTHSGSTGTIPHIIKTYSPAIDGTHYAAFNITNSDDSRFYYMTLAKNSNNTQTFYLPDGYRGIGCMLITSTNDSVKRQGDSGNNIKKIRNDDYYMYLAGFEGNDNTVSLNMSYYSYGKSNDNYSTPRNGNNSTLDLGFGFFNGIRCKYVTTNDTTKSATKIKNLHLKGSVDFDIKTNTGISAAYSTNENETGLLSTGGFTGAVGSDDQNTYFFESISLDKISISGCKFTGGMVGCINLGSGSKGEFHTKNCTADEISVFGGHYAGGMIGLVRNGAAKFIAEFDDNDSFIIKSISSGSNDFGAGGLIGCNRSNTTCNVTNLTLDGAIVRDNSGNAVMYEGTDTPQRLGYIGNNSNNNFSGGVIGYTRRSPIVKIDSCEVKNVVIQGRRAGGAIGYLSNAEQGKPTAEIISFALLADNSDSKLLSVYDNDAAGCGGVIGYIDTSVATEVKITDTTIDGYTITAPKNAGGLIGKIVNNQSVVVKNIGVSGITIKNTTNCGGLIGHLNNGSLLGYNTLTNNITFEKYASSNMSKCGQIVGNNNSKDIKLVVFSRQGTGIQAKMVGNYDENATNQYGSGGYVVFADYKGTTLSSGKNNIFSTIKNTGTNVDAAAPYVTINPKRIVDTSVTPKFLTGDGIYNSSNSSTYAGSMINSILSDISGNSAAYRYQSTGLSETDWNTLSTNLNENKKYSTYVSARGSSSLTSETLKNMPVLILDDSNPTNTTATVNNYLKLLTNTNFTFSSANDAYTVNIAKCTYDASGVLTVTYSGANLANDTTNSQFKLTGTGYDNGGTDEQFTLIDVAFKDPATTNIAYHLYVPVFVKKMLYFDFYAGTISGTTYRTSPYEAVYNNSIVENTGNPITMQFRWVYNRELEDWVKYISSGESMLWNYDKVLDVTDKLSNSLPANTKMILVDANNNNHAFYGTTSTSDLLTITEGNLTNINLAKFETSDSTAENPKRFEPIDFNDFFDIVTSAPTYVVDGETQTWSKDGDGGYYKTSAKFKAMTEEDDTVDAKVKIRTTKYKIDSSGSELYVKFKDGMTVTTTDHKVYLKEDYYITFITPKDTNDALRHLQIGSAMKMPGDSLNPTYRSGHKPTHFYIGDIFDNDFKIKATTPTAEMDEVENPTLKATMTANIGVKPQAGAQLGEILNLPAVNIYQSFLMALKTSYFDDQNAQKFENGFAENSNPSVTVTSFTIAGNSVDALAAAEGENTKIQTLAQMSGDHARIDANYLELRNCADISRTLYTQYNAYAAAIKEDAEQTAVKSTIEIIAQVELKYSTSAQIEAQFPPNSNPQSEQGQQIGTSIEGYSNISTQPDSAKYSKTSKHDEDGDDTVQPAEPINKYYRAATKKATLNYYSADTETVVVTPAAEGVEEVTEEQLLTKNKYDQFGINAVDPARETVEESEIALKTRADYSIIDMNTEAKSSISSIKITVKMYTKADNYNSSNPLTISDYIDTSTLTLLPDPSASSDYYYTGNTGNTKAYVYTAPITESDFTNDILKIPIDFSVYTGKNGNFESLHKQYANYMVHLDVALYDDEGVLVSGSDVESHIIYTNARVCYDIVAPPTS